MSDSHRSLGARRPFSRRNFLMGVTASSAAAPAIARTLRAEAAPAPQRGKSPRDPTNLSLTINDREHRLALDVRTTVLERFFQGFDHPVPSAFPEGLYLKSVLAQVEPV